MVIEKPQRGRREAQGGLERLQKVTERLQRGLDGYRVITEKQQEKRHRGEVTDTILETAEWLMT
jgi:hypothetical protein